MRVDHLEMPATILFLEEMPDKRLAHLLSFIKEVATGIEKAMMVPDALDLANTTAAVPDRVKTCTWCPWRCSAAANSVTCEATPPTATECRVSHENIAIRIVVRCNTPLFCRDTCG